MSENTNHESASQKLERLEAESQQWHKTERGKGYYMHECPDWSTEHNRSIEIDRLRRRCYSDD